MYIAQTKRKENIAEYILYLWQLEDLLRAMQFSPEAIYSALVKPAGLAGPEGENNLLLWYIDLGNLLREEGKEKSGHLDHTMQLIARLHNIHLELMRSPEGVRYRELFERLAPELPALREIVGREEMSDTELMFRALYAVMLYRIKGDATKESSISGVIELVSPVIGELARIFHVVA
jgi:hypothetical protein